jgi:glycosyltransferase involved in cell wall biosynthesis
MQIAAAGPRRRPDIVLAVTPSLLSGLAARFIAARCRVPFILWMQDSVAEATNQTGIDGGGRLSPIVTRLEQLLLRRSDHLVAISPHFAELGRRAGLEDHRLHLVRNWTHVASSTLSRDSARAEMGWRPEDIVALHTGNMGMKQNLENVVQAARLPQNGKRVRFVLMGGGNQERQLRLMAADVQNAEFLPPIPSDRYPDVLAGADVLIVNERPGMLDMSLPSKLTSYLRSGRPVVAAVEEHGTTAKEVLASGGGVVVRPGDPRALREAVVRLATDATLAVSMGRRGQDYCESVLSKEAALPHLEEILQSSVRHRGDAAVGP